MIPPELDISENQDLVRSEEGLPAISEPTRTTSESNDSESDDIPESFLPELPDNETDSEKSVAKCANTATWKPVPDNTPKDAECIPCPADEDFIVFCSDVDAYVKESARTCQCQGGNVVSRYAVLEMDNDALSFVMSKPECREPLILKLSQSKPGFDSTSIWKAHDLNGNPWLVCVHFPVSGRKPIPESCAPYLVPCQFLGKLSETFVQAYPLSNVVTIDFWRNSQEIVSPGIIYLLIDRIAKCLQEIFDSGHTLLRICPDTVVIEKESIRFFGVIALDQPWNERCALAHRQVEYAAIPPECYGFLRQQMTQSQGVYILASIVYFLISGNKVPTCETLGYDVALNPRAFNPGFPIGWDEIVHRALKPNPDHRYADISEFMDALKSTLNIMQKRRDYRDPVRFEVAVDTHIGITKRLRCPVNQDAVYTQSSQNGQRILLIVADGVSTSTYGSGDIASGLLVEKAREIWETQIANAEEINPHAEINNIFYAANNAICKYIRERYADKHPTSSECMGTTALVAIIEKGILTLGSIGDSRAYIIRDNSMNCITRDHNLFTVGIINGLPLEMCATHPHAGSLVQCLGYYEDAEDTVNLSFDVFSMKLIPGDTLMMTTDGILDYVACDIADSEVKIAEIVRAAGNAGLACLELIMQANMGGGGDNCGVGIIRVLDP